MQDKKGPNGFLIGLLLGGAVGALVSTQKGRKILKDIADYGLDYVGENISMEDITDILNQEEEVVGVEVEKTRVTEPIVNGKTHVEPTRRRLFRGIKRK